MYEHYWSENYMDRVAEDIVITLPASHLFDELSFIDYTYRTHKYTPSNILFL